MNAGIDAFPLSMKSASGIPNYVRNSLSHILSIDSSNEYFLYSKNPIFFQNVENSKRRFKNGVTDGATSYGNTIWLFTRGVCMMKKDNIDLFWGTRQMLPPYLPKGIKKVLTVYDLVWYYYPETMDRYNLLISKLLFKRSIKKADHIITISQATAKSLQDVLHVPSDKITIAYPAADGFSRLDKIASAEYISGKYGVNKNYVLTVSTVEPRKNLKTLLRAFSGLKNEGFQLLIAGASGWKNSGIYAEYKKHDFSERDVKFLGYISDDDMNRLYAGASLFVFPSIYEGFGIPPLEAMASGTPVITSNVSSLPEVVGDSGIMITPYDVAAWTEAIRNTLSDKSKCDDMIKRGIERAKMFSWEFSAQQALAVFRKMTK
jgi:glycosyltransferase involved in cell wall biosynthesis